MARYVTSIVLPSLAASGTDFASVGPADYPGDLICAVFDPSGGQPNQGVLISQSPAVNSSGTLVGWNFGYYNPDSVSRQFTIHVISE